MPQEQKKTQNLRLDDEEEFETGEAVSLEEGVQHGTIISAYGEQTPQGYKYFQLEISPEQKSEIKLRYGCPLPNEGKPITTASKLGKLLLAFGLPVGEGNSYSIKQMKAAVEGKRIRFITTNEETRDAQNKLKGTFATITEGTIKPAKPKPSDADEV